MLIDMSYLAHRARHSLKDLVSADIPTGVLYGFFEQLLSICSLPKFASNKVLVFVDSKKSWRTKSFPDYKKKRRENRTEEEQEQINIMYEQVEILRRKVLPAIGIPVYGQKGLESDDLMAWTAFELTKRKESGIIVTSDGDLFQCITPIINWYDPQKDLLLTPNSFFNKKQVRHDQWGLIKAIGGCISDCIPGIRGVSEKGAIDFVHDKIPHHYKKYKAIQNAFNSGELDNWKELVVLPHKKTKPINIRPPKYNPEAFFDFCSEYNIDSYLEGKGRHKWEMFFEGRFNNSPRRRERKARLL